jgi:hypothetical protein
MAYRWAANGDPFPGGFEQCGAPVSTTCDHSDLLPAPGYVLFYLVHAESPFGGSWGQRSSGSEIVVSCVN